MAWQCLVPSQFIEIPYFRQLNSNQKCKVKLQSLTLVS